MCTSRDAPESRTNSLCICICICVFLEKERKEEGDAGERKRGRKILSNCFMRLWEEDGNSDKSSCCNLKT